MSEQPGRFDAGSARTAAQRSAQRRKRLTLADVDAALPPLVTLEDAKHRLDQLGRWIAGGMLSGTQGMGAVRSVEAWCRAFESEMDRQALKAAEHRISELEGELKASRGLKVMP
jgi:hypothetical protein